jgi:hypothetical protein
MELLEKIENYLKENLNKFANEPCKLDHISNITDATAEDPYNETIIAARITPIDEDTDASDIQVNIGKLFYEYPDEAHVISCDAAVYLNGSILLIITILE